MSSTLQKSLDEVIQAIKDGTIDLKQIVKAVCPEKPKMSKEERKQKKTKYYQEWYERNKEYHKIYRAKVQLKKKVEQNELNKEDEFNEHEQPGSQEEGGQD
jgi:tRNA U54 and U55 pseudouridine synthase Pus10